MMSWTLSGLWFILFFSKFFGLDAYRYDSFWAD